MYNSTPPNSELPSSRQLVRSTVLALIVAIVLLVTVVLPAEYAIDPTGIGRVLGLTDMGQIKAQLAEEAAADAAKDNAEAATRPAATGAGTVATTSGSAPDAGAWRDQQNVVLPPGEGIEIKLVMKAGEKADYAWSVESGVVNFDMHGDGGASAISYEKGRGVASSEGVLEAAFDGNHGWFWRNRGEAPVTVTIRTRGDYTEMKRM